MIPSINGLEQRYNLILNKHLYRDDFREIYQYALFPAGKMIRPLLTLSVAQDLDHHISDNHYLWGLVLESHHAYTLIHDDLPALDNDDYRRGKPSTHKQYGEWQAILAGDGLLNLSYRLLSQIESPQLPVLLKVMSWACGPKGLIKGQINDLHGKTKLGAAELLEVHRLKTARLFQLALLGGSLLSENNNRRTTWDLAKLGDYFGISFQLIDDLIDLAEQNDSAHELAINPFIAFPECAELLENYLQRFSAMLHKYQLPFTQQLIHDYLKKSLTSIENNRSILCKYVDEKKLDSIELALKR